MLSDTLAGRTLVDRLATHRLPQLDGLRGLAILLVILHNEGGRLPSLHLEMVFANGWMGVDLFFVLSGFLITGILLDTKESPGYFRNFFARRCLRIWPLYASLLLFMFVAVPFVLPSEGPGIFERSSPWWAYPLFLQNFLVSTPAIAVGPLGVTWSVAIEEQFYLVWPLIVRFCSAARIRWVAIAVICLSPVLRFSLLLTDVDLYTNLFCRLDGLMAGALIAVMSRSSDLAGARSKKLAWLTLAVSLPVAFVLEDFGARWIVYSLSAAASAALVYLSLVSSNRILYKILTNRFIVYTGTISYGLYLLHKIPFGAAAVLQLDRYPLVAAPLSLAACYGVAALSWYGLERPILRLKRFFRFARPGMGSVPSAMQ